MHHLGRDQNVLHTADLARRQLVVVECQGQAHIVRFCAKVTPWAKPGS
jgi:hypothetical protein